MQKKTFTKWVNSHLALVSCRISDLYTDLRDGCILTKLLEVLSGEQLVRRAGGLACRLLPSPKRGLGHGTLDVRRDTATCPAALPVSKWALSEGGGALWLPPTPLFLLPPWKPKPTRGRMRIHSLENVDKALQFLKEQRVHLENVGSHDIVDGNQRLTLGLVWTIILRFQVWLLSREGGREGHTPCRPGRSAESVRGGGDWGRVAQGFGVRKPLPSGALGWSLFLLPDLLLLGASKGPPACGAPGLLLKHLICCKAISGLVVLGRGWGSGRCTAGPTQRAPAHHVTAGKAQKVLLEGAFP